MRGCGKERKERKAPKSSEGAQGPESGGQAKAMSTPKATGAVKAKDQKLGCYTSAQGNCGAANAANAAKAANAVRAANPWTMAKAAATAKTISPAT